jgi:hypothetical protein
VNLDINILFNSVLGALSFLGGWLFTRVFSLFDKQEKLIKDLNDKTFSDFIILRKELEAESRKNEQDIADLALKVSTTYATKDTVENAMEKIEDKLDRNFDLIQQYFFDKD